MSRAEIDLGGFRHLRRIGPFDRDSLPQGILHQHRLKPGRWGLLELGSGSVDFVWDDDGASVEKLVAPAKFLIPPEKPHHLVPTGDCLIEITFMELCDEGDT